MKNLLFSIVLMCFSLFTMANQTITVGGTVTDENTGLAVPDQMVFLYTDSTANNPGYFNIVYSGANGVYADVFEVSGNSPAGFVNIFTFDCSGVAEFQQLPYGNGVYNLTADFQICTGNIQPYDCYADFWWWQNEDLMVQFQDYSWPTPTTWAWDFGDGQTSAEQNPLHQFAQTGQYLVTLTIFVAETNCTSTTSWEVWVDSYNYDCQAVFYWNQSWMDPLAVEFYDYSWFVPGTWNWQFGDGQFSMEQNPVHTYAEPGIYEVTLTINGADSSCYDQYTEIIYLEEIPYGCWADFGWYQSGLSTVQFQNFSTPPNSSTFWDFGDGTSSTEQNPEHVFAGLGVYEVCLTIGDPNTACQDTRCYEVWVDTTNYIECKADFWYYQMEDLKVEFQDFSWPMVSSWVWDFGDGQTSAEQNPIHQYAQPGIYPVTLTIFVEETGCTSTTSYEIWVDEFNPDCNAYYYWIQSWADPLTVEFYDNSWFVPGSWYWQFGDGQVSMEQNPVHSFAEPGIYEVTLTINGADSTCYDQYTEVIYLEELPYGCWADFWWYQNGLSTVQFQNYSFPPNSTSFWDFGDGTSSTEQNPEHVYAGLGVYEVCLTIGDPAIGCQDTRCYEVWVDTSNYIECKADFWYYQMENLTVQFQDYSWPQVTTWAWDFGDGQSSAEQNPVHQYAETGIYPVMLTIFIEETGCTSTAFYEVWVDNYNYGCEAKYFWMPGPQNPLTVEFFDASMYNTPVSWFWDFGDGNTSYEQNPVHTFATEDVYQVCLMISSPDSSCYSQFCSAVYPGGVVPPDCMNDFEVFDMGNLTFNFEGFVPSTMPSEFFWDFGDGAAGQGQSVTHTYSEPGSYAVCLTTMSFNPSDSCFFTSCKGVYAGNGSGSMQAGFVMQPDSMNVMVYHFYDTSTGNPIFWMWDFGDGSTSTEQNPIHEYAATGWYEVCLTIIGNGITDTYCIGFEMNAGALNIAEPGKQLSIGEIYPNPNDGNFDLKISLTENSALTISVINYLGQEVYSRSENMTAGNNNLNISFPEIPQGIYSFMITSQNQKLTKKFIIR
jgi:PKD repeat protein